MRQILFLLLFSISLLGSDFIDTFYTQQIALEVQIKDQNLSDEVLGKAITEGQKEYLRFFIDYLTYEKKKQSIDNNPYRAEVFKLNQRVRINQQRQNSYAVSRDQLKIESLTLKQNFRKTMLDVAHATRSASSVKEFEEKLQEIIVKRHEKDASIDLSRYVSVTKITDPDSITKNVQENLYELQHILVIHNSLSAALIDNANKLYKITVISGYGILSLTINITESAVGRTLDPYLQYVYLSSAKLFFIMTIVLMTFLIRKTMSYLLVQLLTLVGIKEGDIDYIFGKIARPFTLFLIILGSELILFVYSGLAEAPNLLTLYNISYIFMVSFFIYRLGNAIAVIKMEELQRNKLVRNEVINLGLKVMNGIVGLVALILILKMLDVNLTAILSGLGIGGVAVAFAAKDTIANFFGSISILLSDLFEQGDWIAVDDMEGTVVEIGLRATTVRTFDNALIAIPNFKLADSGIKNWSRRTMGRRIKMKIGVTYESDMENIKKALVEIREMLHNHPDIVTEKTEYSSSERQLKLVSKEDLKGIKRMIMVNLDEFNSSSIDILVYCFSRSVVWKEWMEVKEDVMFKIAEILKENDLEFAYPTMMIHRSEEDKAETTE